MTPEQIALMREEMRLAAKHMWRAAKPKVVADFAQLQRYMDAYVRDGLEDVENFANECWP